MQRRQLVALSIAALAMPRALFAQSKRVYRIGVLDDAVESALSALWPHFRNRLRELVLKDGNDVAYEARYASGATERLPTLAAELVALKPDLIVVVSTPATLALAKATTTIPIVFNGIGDPLSSGIVSSLARPGGNLTGTSIRSSEVGVKLLDLLLEIAPRAKRLAYLSDVKNKSAQATFEKIKENAARVAAKVLFLDARRRSNLERSLETLRRERVQGLIVGAGAVLVEHREPIVQFAAQNRLPVVYGRRDYMEIGGLLAYGAGGSADYARTADYAYRILRGGKPADLPVEQSTKLNLLLNLKTARALGIKIPDSIRLRADEVIE
jgi:putative ABC transport system substrate-binding protein